MSYELSELFLSGSSRVLEFVLARVKICFEALDQRMWNEVVES